MTLPADFVAAFEQSQTTCKAAPVFICGMFRSGSTLTEQILAAHPSMQKGDELDILPSLIKRRLAPFPERLRGILREGAGAARRGIPVEAQ